MNRSQRRKLQREQDKEIAVYNSEEQWLSNLKTNQKAILEHIIKKARVEAEIDCIETVDKILTGALLEHGLTWDEAYNFNAEFGRYYAEYKFQIAKIGKEKRLKMLVELENEIVGKIEKGIASGETRGQIIKKLKEDYKGVGITTPEANNVYGRTLNIYQKYIEEIKETVTKDIIDLIEKDTKTDKIIKSLNKKYAKISENDLNKLYSLAKEEYMKPKYSDYSEVPAVKKSNSKKKTEKKKVVENKAVEKETIEIKENVKPVENKGKLKVINEVVKVVKRELEGEFGKYVIDENGVKREDMQFADLAAVEEYRKEQLAKFELEIAELQAVFAYQK